MKSLVVSDSTDDKYRKTAASNIVNSDLLKDSIQDQVLSNINHEFTEFLGANECPLRDGSIFKNLSNMEEFDFKTVMEKCVEVAPNLVKTLGTICFGVEEVMRENSKYLTQRLLTVIAISSISRNQSYNILQKMIGEFCKLKGSNKQVMQLLQRMGLSLVTMTIRSDMDIISKHFMHEVLVRKEEIENWAVERKMLEKEVKKELLECAQSGILCSSNEKLSIKFTPSEMIPQIVDIGEINIDVVEGLVTSPCVQEMIEKNNSAKEALENHLDNFPPPFSVTYDNLDIGVTPNEYICDVSKDQSLHWCSSVISQDVVLGTELTDNNPERSENLNLSELVKLTSDEKNHLLLNYTKVVVNTIVTNWPECFPELKSEKMSHQYTKQFEAGVKSFTGPLVCETESSIEGISCVIKTIVDVVCPSVVDENGVKVPVLPTTFRYTKSKLD